MKQQTLEEAINEIGGVHPDWKPLECFKKGFKEGVIWQKKQSPWISVKDKLPDNQDIVLVRDEYGGVCTAYLHGPKSGFITYGEEAYCKFGEITHWMPIPPLESNGNGLERKE